MCIIVVKPAGKTVSREILETCFENNDDGAGYMFACEGKTLIKKGFFTFDDFWACWEKTRRIIGDNCPVVFHFRISTGGNLDKTNCHPHRISKDLAFVHNGILFSVKKDSRVSDTIIYRDRYLRDFTGAMLAKRGLLDLVARDIGEHNKFVFLNGRGEYAICNESSGVWVEGIWYSNSTYRPSVSVYNSNFSGTGFADDIAGDLWDEYDPADYCQECGEALQTPIEQNLGTCDLCGAALYGQDWEQYRREAEMSIRDNAEYDERAIIDKH